jgi:hypothetical protein
MVRHLKIDALTDQQYIATNRNLVNELPANSKIVGVVPQSQFTKGIKLSFAVSPFPFLYLIDYHLKDIRTKTVLEKFNPDYFLIDNQVLFENRKKLKLFGISGLPIKKNIACTLFKVKLLYTTGKNSHEIY